MPKEEVLVKTERFSDTSGVAGKLGWIGDNMNPIGWGFQLFGKAGLTWGTQEVRTVTQSPYETKDGKQKFNLPIDIRCPGDPNYFKVYVESEKIYTVRNGQRVDLQWTYYGYGELPVKGSDVEGPAVKPTIKLTVYNPVGDANGKLARWQNNSMTVEETQYVTDVNSPHHGRIASTTQRILDANGNTVPNSTVVTVLNYSLTDRKLKTTTTVTAGNAPAVTSSQTINSLSNQLIEAVDRYGNRTIYQYDNQGRLTNNTEFADSSSLGGSTQYSYVDGQTESTITRISALNEQTHEVRDTLDRPIKSQQLHSDNWTWLTLSETAYNAQNLESSITEYDYKPDGTPLLSQTRYFSYNDQGKLSRIKWSSGAIQEFDYDPISQQQSEWTTYGNEQTGTTTRLFDEPGGGQREERFIFSNGQLVSSHTRIIDALGRITQESSSDSPTRQYSYDAFGRPTRITVDGVTTVNTYPAHILTNAASAASLEYRNTSLELGKQQVDSLGRITATTFGNQSTTFSYTGIGNWGQTSNQHMPTINTSRKISLSSSFDPKRRMITETTTGGVDSGSDNRINQSTYSYSLRGLLLNSTDAFGNTTNYVYDNLGQLTQTISSTFTVNFTYDTPGRLAYETLTDLNSQKTITTVYLYDAKGREVQRQFSADGFRPLTLIQEYSNSSRITSLETQVEQAP